MGREFYGKGANVQLGPGLNIARVPLNGRNFEYMSGGDSFLGYTLVQPVVKGIQSQGVIANAKHWVENNQETDRDTVSENVDERTRHELYYRPFAGAVEAGVGSFMCSYNKINQLWSCENPETLSSDLKGHLGFEGWVMSDWGATHSLSLLQGLDQEMPGDEYFGSVLKTAVESGDIAISAVDAAVMRILTPMFEVGLFDSNNTNTLANDVRSEESTKAAREIAAASHVLLKNEGFILPLSATAGPLKIALFGGAARAPIVAGGGSGSVFPSHVVSPYEGILKALGIEDAYPVEVTCDPSSYLTDVKVSSARLCLFFTLIFTLSLLDCSMGLRVRTSIIC
jgi:beta-glucosidase